MKKCLIAIAMVLTLGMNVGAAAQNHRHTPRTELADSTKNNQDAIEAFSDTTAVDTTYNNDDATNRNVNVSLSDDDVKGVIHEVMSNIDGELIFALLLGMGILFVLFVLIPIIIIVVVIRYINKNRRERYRLAEMAVQNGQPIPENLLKEEQAEAEDEEYNKGIRQLFLGIGLMFFLGYTAGTVGFGIGALVFFIGLGKVVIAKTSVKKAHENQDMNNNPQDI